MFSRRQWFLLGGSIVAILGLTRIVEAQEPSEEDNCKPVGENSINLTSTAKIRHDEHALIDGPWCDRTSPWRVRYSNAKEGLGLQSFPTLDSAKRAVEQFEPTKKFKFE
jgi:hypothetical protein